MKVDPRKFIKDKMMMQSRGNIVKVLTMAISMRAIRGLAYLKCWLRRIELVRELFLMEIERGHEVLIPYYMSQDQYPASMRYYDPIIAIVQENISEVARHQFAMKNLVAYSVHK